MDTQKITIEACPVCHSKKIRPLWSNTQGYNFSICNHCGFYFVNPQPSASDLERYYSEQYFLVGIAESGTTRTEVHESERAFVDAVEKTILKHNPDARTICEVGCSFGHELSVLQARGFDVVGYEVAPSTATFAREHFGLDVHISEFVAQPDAYDVVFMSHVLEHLSDPNSLIEAVYQSLRPNGLLLVVGPNSGSLNSRLFGKHCSWVSPPNHLSYFTPSAQTHLLQRNEFLVVDKQTKKGRGVNFFLGIALAIVSASNQEEQLKAQVGGIRDNSKKNTLSKGKRLALRVCNRLHWLTYPIWYLVDRAGYGEELWLVGQK